MMNTLQSMHVSRTTIQNFSWENNCFCHSWYCGGDLHSGGFQICLLRGSGRGKGSRQWNQSYSGSHGRRRRYYEVSHTFRCRENGINVVKESSRSCVFISVLLLLLFCFCISFRYVSPVSQKSPVSPPPSYPTLILIKFIFFGTLGSCSFLFFSSFNSFFKLLYLASSFAPIPFEFCILTLHVGRRQKNCTEIVSKSPS